MVMTSPTVYDEPVAAADEDVYIFPASSAQWRLWLLDQLEPGSPAYNMAAMLQLPAALDPAALRRSLEALVRRHESLRTTFIAVGGQPMQAIAPEAGVKIPLPVVDLRDLPAEEREEVVRRLRREEARRPFDLARGPLLRAALLHQGAQGYVLLLSIHHIIADEWSMGVLLGDLAALYNAAVAGVPAPLPELPIQYADYAQWQREALEGEALEEQRAYWRRQLAGTPDALELPTDRPRPPQQSFEGITYGFEVPASIEAGLRRLGRQERATLFMTLLAAFQALLHRYTGRDDIVVGSPVAGRTQPELEGLIGLFINMLVLRGDLAGDPTFRELLGRARGMALDAYDHQDVPFEHLVEELRPARDPSRNPLFQVMFVLQNAPTAAVELAGAPLQQEWADTGTAKVDLTLYVVETEDGGLRGLLEYNTDLFEEATIARMAEHFRTLLEGIAADPDRRLSALPLLTEVERRQLLVDWNSTVAPLPEATLPALVAAQAARTPDAVAVVCADEELTYAALEGRADRLARRLRELGVGPDVLVGLYTERSLAMVVGLLGILKAGGAYVPLDPSFPVERLAFMAADAALPVLVTQAALVGRLPAHAARVVLLDDPDPDPDAAAGDAGDAGGGATLDDLAYVLYTSGSTGHPKGVQIPHRALVNFLASMRRAPGLTAADTLLAVTTLSFDIAGLELYLPLIVGARLVVAGRDVAVDGAALAATLTRTGATVMQATPATWRLLLDAGWQGDPRLTALCGGEALPGELAARLRPRVGALWNMYGPTETTIWSTIQEVAEPVGAAGEVVPIGRPIANTQTYVLDGHMRPVPVGVPGELCIGGAGLARGYLGRPALTAERFVPDPFATAPGARLYKTGDRARYRPDGTLEYLGRLDNQVKVRGYRIELGEVEATLAAHPAVRQAVVTVREDTPGDARLVAYVVPEPGGAPAAEELRALLRERLPAYMVPSAFVALAAFPLTPNGKVDRRALPAPDAAQPADTDAGAAAQGDLMFGPGPEQSYLLTIHHQLIAIWEELLNVCPIGVNDDFFELGGHSLLAARLVDRIEQATGKKIPLATLFAGATIQHLVEALLLSDDHAAHIPLIEVQAGGSKRPFFFLHGDLGGGGFYCRALARALGPEQPFYALEPYRLADREAPHTVEAMATAYIEAARSVQPQGPYQLGGLCNGGLVAFEMARQLRAAGQAVDLLVLLDAGLAGRRHRRAHRLLKRGNELMGRGAQEQLDLFLRLRGRYLNLQGERGQTRSLMSMGIGEMIGLAREAALSRLRWPTRHRGAPGRDSFAGLRRALNVPPTNVLRKDPWSTYRWVISGYTPGPYPGRVTYFHSGGEAGEGRGGAATDWRYLAAADWRRVAEEVDVHAVPGEHLTSMTRHVGALASELRACLDGVQADRGPGGG